MITASNPPFSFRNQAEFHWIEEDFPQSARVGLLHLLSNAVEKDYLSSWATFAKEIGRMARVPLVEYDSRYVASLEQAQRDAEANLNQLNWDRVYDFCERLYSHLLQGTTISRNDDDSYITKPQAQLFIADELQRLFDEERLGYELRDGSVQRRGKRHTIGQINKAQDALADHRLTPARKHFAKSLHYFRKRGEPDFENVVKEAVCAVEAAAKELFPEAKAATLGDFVNWATNKSHSLVPKTIGQTFLGLYAFRSSGEGVAHGAATGGAATVQVAEYVLSIAASQIIFLADLATEDEEIPF